MKVGKIKSVQVDCQSIENDLIELFVGKELHDGGVILKNNLTVKINYIKGNEVQGVVTEVDEEDDYQKDYPFVCVVEEEIMSEEKEEVKKEEKIRARDVSLIGKVVGMLIILFTVAILIVLLVLNVISTELAGVIFDFSAKGALSILALFGTVDINLAIDKITKRN